MPRRTSALALTLTLLSVLGLAGCGRLSELVSASDEAMLEQVSLTADDAAAAARYQLPDGGDEVAGQTSLDLCVASFPSERLRIGRRQVWILRASTGEVSSEAVLYSTPAEAEQAMGELAQARQECPETPVPAPDSDTALLWRFAAAPDSGWTLPEGVQRQAYAFTVTAAEDSSQSGSFTAVYLQRGRMILALYSTPPDAPAGVIVNAPDPERFTEVMTNRLLTLPPRALEQGDAAERVQDPRDLGT